MKDTLRRAEHGTELPGDFYTAVVQRHGAHSVQVAVCLNRNASKLTKAGIPDGKEKIHVQPGAYTGTMVLEAADGTTAATIPITIKVQYQHLAWLLILLLPPIFIGGAAFVYASGRGSGEAKPLLSGEGFIDVMIWLRDGIIHFAGGVAAAVVAFVGTAVNNPTFGSDSPKQFFSLLGVIFAAYTTALAAGSAAFRKPKS